MFVCLLVSSPWQYEAFFGSVYLMVFLALTVTFSVVSMRLRMFGERRLQEFSRRTLGSASKPLEPGALRSRLPGVCVIVLVLVLAMLATTVFSPVFVYSSQSYFKSTSEFALLSVTFNAKFTAKLFEDVVVYYSVMVSLALLGVAAHQVRGVKRFLHIRLRVPGNARSQLHPFPHGIRCARPPPSLYTPCASGCSWTCLLLHSFTPPRP